MVRYEKIVNHVSAVLNGAINDTVTSITLVDGSVYPTEGDFRILIESEVMLVTARSTHVLTVVRGVESTTAASHSDGLAVDIIMTTAGIQTYIDHQMAAPSARPASRIQDVNGDLLTASSFTWDNQGSATVTDDADGSITLQSATTAGTQMNVLYKAIPQAAPWTVTAGFLVGPGWTWDSASGSRGGLHAYSTATGRFIILNPQLLSVWRMDKYLTSATLLSTVTGFNPNAANPWFWLQIEDDNVDLFFRVSHDGVNFFELGSESRTSWMAAGATSVGIAMMQRGQHLNKALHLKSWVEA